MMGRNIILVMPAYNAAKTLSNCLKTLPRNLFDDIVLVDDCSKDQTLELARKLGLTTYKTSANIGYGGNMKICLAKAIEAGADIVVELHPDGEYLPDAILPAVDQIFKGAGLVLGNRFTPTTDPLKTGMFWWKYPFLRFLNYLDNLFLGTKIPDIHQGFRVYSTEFLRRTNFLANSNDFLFTFEIILQALAQRVRISSVPVGTHYSGKKRGAPLWAATKYTIGTFVAVALYWLNHLKWVKPVFLKGEYDQAT